MNTCTGTHMYTHTHLSSALICSEVSPLCLPAADMALGGFPFFPCPVPPLCGAPPPLCIAGDPVVAEGWPLEGETCSNSPSVSR